jgi:cystathionine beta-synthase
MKSILFQSYVANKDVADKPIKEIMENHLIVKHGTPLRKFLVLLKITPQH